MIRSIMPPAGWAMKRRLTKLVERPLVERYGFPPEGDQDRITPVNESMPLQSRLEA
jgi:hypothetical protein